MKQGLRVLLFALLVLLAIFPFLLNNVVGKAVFVLLSTAIMLAGAYASSATRRTLAIALLVAMPAMITRWSDLFAPTHAMFMAAIAASMLLYGYIAGLVFLRVLRAEEVRADEIYGGVAVYILIGLVWAYAYTLLETAQPGSFFTGGEPAELSLFGYYSFTTLMTVGYGDVHPLTAPARSLSIFEGLAGTFFMAVFISRLVAAARVRGR
jgi:Zn-dependent protease with chaperone function